MNDSQLDAAREGLSTRVFGSGDEAAATFPRCGHGGGSGRAISGGSAALLPKAGACVSERRDAIRARE